MMEKPDSFELCCALDAPFKKDVLFVPSPSVRVYTDLFLLSEILETLAEQHSVWRTNCNEVLLVYN